MVQESPQKTATLYKMESVATHRKRDLLPSEVRCWDLENVQLSLHTVSHTSCVGISHINNLG